MEAASYALPAINIGIRQQGREHAANVIDIPANADAITAAISQARSPGFRLSLAGMKNPYGDGHAAEKIATVLAETSLEGLLIKAPTPIPQDSPYDFRE
jgi:UDP-N-acetylglucosamine 2-epimerase (non-hydrolysing)/GDP/UDP-N,N'-diacetylbacillosamine 2-epimerase (hydrolysing)